MSPYLPTKSVELTTTVMFWLDVGRVMANMKIVPFSPAHAPTKADDVNTDLRHKFVCSESYFGIRSHVGLSQVSELTQIDDWD